MSAEVKVVFAVAGELVAIAKFKVFRMYVCMYIYIYYIYIYICCLFVQVPA